MPKNESFVETPEGVGTVSQVNLLKETVTVRLEEQPDSPKCFHNCEICVVRNGKGKRPEGYVAPPPEELAKLRKVTPAEEPRTLTESLNASLADLGVSAPAAEEEPAPRRRSRNRRRKSAGAQAEPPAQEQQAKPAPQRQRQPKGEERPKPAEQAKAEGGQAPGEKPAEKKRPRRRYHRKPKGERPQEQSQ